MKLLLLCVFAFCVFSVSATPTPQFFGMQPLTPFGNWLQNSLQNPFQNFPRPNFFQNTFWNSNRPSTAQPQPSQQVTTDQQVVPVQTNAQWPQTSEPSGIPDRQISNAAWYWQNWIPLPVIPQYGQDQSPTIIIISRPAKPVFQNAQTISSANSSSNPSMNVASLVPSLNETDTSSPVAVSNSSELSQSAPSTPTPDATSTIAQTAANTSSAPGEN